MSVCRKTKLLSYEILLSASRGDADAIAAVLNHYDHYITALCTRALYDEDENLQWCVDYEMRQRLETKLTSCILHFDADKVIKKSKGNNTEEDGVSKMYNYNSDGKIASVQQDDIAKLLRSMGATGNFKGFDYIVFIIFQKLQHPNQQYWTTKMAYPETGAHFNVTPGAVERSIRTVICAIWDKFDHSDIDRVAGRHLEDIPTNTEFFDIVAAYLSYGAYPRDESYFRY